MIRVMLLLVVLTLLVLVSAGISDPPDTMDAARSKRVLKAVSLATISDTTPIWTDPLPDSTVIALRLALKHLDPHIVDMFTPGFIDEASTLRWRADQLDKKQRDIALIKRVLRAWEARP